MLTPKDQNEKHLFAHIRFNKHFRIKSASKDKIFPSKDIHTIRARRKDIIEDTKRILSENRHIKNSSLDTYAKIRITKEELEKRFETASRAINKTKPIYQSVKTEDDAHAEENRPSNSHTIHHDEARKTCNRFTKLCDPNQIPTNASSDSKSVQPDAFKKTKNQSKGKYRCRVNQFVFDSCRKKSGFNKEQQQSLDEFWKNVNQSLILPAKQEEQVSKELQEFVEHFVTE